MSEGTIRIALVGAGGWGRQHARIFADREDVDFCAVVGRTREKTEARAARYGTRAYLDIHEMLEKEKPDLVSLCLPNQGHFEATLQVIEAGFPLFVEKPLVFDPGEADTLLSEAEQRGLFFGINFNHRYAKPVQLARQAITEGKLGELVFATWRFGGEGSDAPRHENLIETQCHGFDMLEHLCGPIVSIAAQMTRGARRPHTTLVLALEFAHGAVGSLVGTYDSSYAYPLTHLVEVNGSEGRAVIEDTVKRFTLHRKGHESYETWEAGYFNDGDRGFLRTFDRHFEDVLQAFRAGDPPPVPAAAGRRALQLAHAAIRAFETGTTVRVPNES